MAHRIFAESLIELGEAFLSGSKTLSLDSSSTASLIQTLLIIMSDKPAGSEKKIAAGICGILLGALGVHKFILGYTLQGIIMLVLTTQPSHRDAIG